MRIISETQRKVMRAGALVVLLAAPILLVVAASTLPTLLQEDEITWVAEGESEFELADPGLFGSSSTVYGSTTEVLLGPKDLGCRLLSEDGEERGGAQLSELAVVTKPPITVDGTELSPLFEVSYAKGDRVQCDDLQRVTPVGYTASSTFGSSTAMVLMASLTGVVTCLALGIGAFFAFGPRGPVDDGRSGWRF